MEVLETLDVGREAKEIEGGGRAWKDIAGGGAWNIFSSFSFDCICSILFNREVIATLL